jgi:hypothetical protein
MVEELAKKNGTYTPESISVPSLASSGSNETPPVKASGKLLSLLMPTVTPILVKNSGIFGLYIFDLSVRYSTYRDEVLGLSIIPTEITYDAFLQNIKALGGKPYSINEVKTFSFRAFYLNPEILDTLVRVVIDIE